MSRRLQLHDRGGNGSRPPANAVASAAAAGLRYVSDRSPGIRRRRSGRGFVYVDPRGNSVCDAQVLRRIRAIVIPPAWTEVWICQDQDGHLQAVGRDARRRKQYRYHERWRTVRDRTKYHRMVAFARALPRIRRRVKRDLALPGLPREKVLAAMVALLERTQIRIGNAEYARHNNSHGLTTLTIRHVEVSRSRLRFRFRGKSARVHEVVMSDPRLAKIVRRCQEIPGQELFQYVDDQGAPRSISSGDVNEYLREISGEDFTAKDFRTWAGTVLASASLKRLEPAGSRAEAKGNVVRVIADVAERLGNTPAICRKSYIHPQVIDDYLEAAARKRGPAGGTTLVSAAKQRRFQKMSGRLAVALKDEEAAVVSLLESAAKPLCAVSIARSRSRSSCSGSAARSDRSRQKRSARLPAIARKRAAPLRVRRSCC